MKKIVFFFFFGALFVGGYAQFDLQSATAPWDLSGNAGTTDLNFLGTTDGRPVIFKTSNTERMRLLSDKSFLGIGHSNPQATLHLHYSPYPMFLIPPVDPFPIKLLQLTTPATGSGANNGFSILYNYASNDVILRQQDPAKFFIEGPGGGLTISPNGHIGVGTNTPRQKLHIENGNLLISKTSPYAYASMIFETGHGNPIGKWSVEYQYPLRGLHFENSNLLYNSVLFLADNNRVGIGQMIPQATLHLHSPTDVSGERRPRLLNITTASATDGFVVSYSNNDISFRHYEQANFSIEGPSGGLTIS
ncbi:MAG: hypothetical protein FWC34_03070, partial [Bacteroidetes bacterium]|nr:hypothetical protein [Bacteroidota bacterium]MCL2303551.1 hypothetical protein [Lentimicrobiaceae bacterium]